MNGRITLAALIVVVVALCSASLLAAEDFKGKVINSGDGKLVVAVGEEQTEFTFNDDTKITLDGKDAALGDILAGHMVDVTAEREGDQLIAKTIAARTAF